MESNQAKPPLGPAALGMLGLLFLSELLVPRTRPVFDDLYILTQNTFVRDLELGRIWSSLYWDGSAGTIASTENLQRPLFLTLLALLGGKFVFLRMLTLLAHFTVGYLLALWLHRKERLPEWAAAAIGALFLFHPAQVEAATQLIGLQEILPGLFGLLAFFWLGSSRSLLGACLLATAPGWKETGYIWLLAYLLATATRRGKERWIAGAALSCWLAHRVWVSGSLTQFRAPPISLVNPLVALGPGDAFFMQLSLVGHHFRLLLAPFGLSSDYSLGTLPMPGTRSFLFWASVGAIAIPATLYALKRVRSWPAGTALASALPSLHLFGATGMIFAERFGYMPRWGILYLLGAGLARADVPEWARPRARAALIAGLSLALAASYGLMLKRQAEWRDLRTLLTADSARYPENAKLHFGLGNALANEEDWSGARAEFERSIALYPGFPPARQRLELVLEKLKAK